MNAAYLLKTYRKALNPPYRGKDLLVILATLLILISIPLIVIGIPKARAPRGRAAYSVPTLYLAPASQSVNQNSTFTVQVREDSQTQTVNAVSAYLSYPADKLDVTGLDYTGSGFPTQVESTYGGGSIRMTRGLPTVTPPATVTGDQLVGTITFKAKVGSGPASVSFATGSMLARSPDYTDILVDKIGGTYTVVDPPPTVSITNPANNATIKGTVTVQANSTDDLAVTKVEFLVDGGLRSTVTAAPWEYSLNTLSPVLSDGAHTISAKAYDATSSATATVNVIVDNNAPTVSISYPANNAYVKGTVTVTVAYNDTVGVTKVEYYPGGGASPAYTANAAPFSFPWNTTGLNQAITLQAKAYDNANNVGTSATITVTVDNIAPTVVINSPATGVYLRTSVDVTATPNDANLLNVEFSLDTSLKCTDSVTPYTCSISLTSTSDGPHTIYAKANDRAGNSATASISVTIDNTVPTAPTGLTASPASGTQVNLTWTASTDATSGIAGYDVYRDGNKVNSTTVTGLSYSDTGLTVNTTYTYHVKAVDRAGNVSAASTTVNATTRKIGDFNGDGRVNVLDFSKMLTFWGTNEPSCDANNDGIVNVLDFSALLTYWEG